MNDQAEAPYCDASYSLTNGDGPTDMVEDQEAYTFEQPEGCPPDTNGHPPVVNDVFETLVVGMQSAFQNFIAPLAFDYGQELDNMNQVSIGGMYDEILFFWLLLVQVSTFKS